MSKPQYLTKDDKGWKLRRLIPKHLRELSEKTTFVERVGRISQKEAYQKARLFGVATDLTIRDLQSRFELDSSSANKNKNEPGFNFILNKEQAENLAISYFQKIDEKYYSNRKQADDFNASQVREDLSRDLSEAVSIVNGGVLHENEKPYSVSNSKAVKLLVESGYLSSDEIYQFPDDNTKRSSRNKPKMLMPNEITLSRNFKFLCHLLERADVELASKHLRTLDDGSFVILDKLFDSTVSKGTTSKDRSYKPSAHTLRDLVDAFLTIKDKEVGASRRLQMNIPVRLLIEQFDGNILISDINSDMANEIVELLPRIPSHVTQQYKSMTLKKAIDKSELKNGGMANRFSEGKKKLDIIKSVFQFAVENEWLDRNIFQYKKIVEEIGSKAKFGDKDNGYESFSIDDLNSIFKSPTFTNSSSRNTVRDHEYWAPIVSLYTGMRMNEILQLEKTDVELIDDVWCFQVTDVESGNYSGSNFIKKVKNKNAIRIIPIHDKLIEFGFVKWCNKCDEGRLFPKAISKNAEKPSLLYSKKFARLLKKEGVWKKHRKVFHSFRNTFNDALRRGDVPAEIREAINGWQSSHQMDAKYGKGYSSMAQKLKTEINKVSYEGLNIKKITNH